MSARRNVIYVEARGTSFTTYDITHYFEYYYLIRVYMEKVLITGTGRSGTTFLIKLFSFLGFDTGYTRNNYHQSISANCNSGMERGYRDDYYILKSPTFILDIEQIIEDTSIAIKNVIIPIRDLEKSAESRAGQPSGAAGGLWHAHDVPSQIEFYKNALINYLIISTKHDLNTTFLDFDRMVSDKRYLFNKVKSILDEKNVTFEAFSIVYDEVSATSRPAKTS